MKYQVCYEISDLETELDRPISWWRQVLQVTENNPVKKFDEQLLTPEEEKIFSKSTLGSETKMYIQSLVVNHHTEEALNELEWNFRRVTLETVLHRTVVLQSNSSQEQRTTGGIPHRIEQTWLPDNQTTANCSLCNASLPKLKKDLNSPAKFFGYACRECPYMCHQECAAKIPNTCVPKANESSRPDSPRALASTLSTANQNKSFASYLYKRGALLKGWKVRYFVLDAMEHKLRQYEDNYDLNRCLASLALEEVVSVTLYDGGSNFFEHGATLPNGQTQKVPLSSLPKKLDERCVFEIRTSKKNIVLCANSAGEAQDWVDRLQAAITSG